MARELARRARDEVPRAVRERALTGEVLVAFEIGDGGVVTRARIERSSGHPLLDRAVLALVAKPFPTACRGESRWPVRWRAPATR